MLIHKFQMNQHQVGMMNNMASTTPKVFNINDFHSNKNYVIEASAGTGKTFSIVMMVQKLLSENKDLSLDQILIVTYTEKAAGELKDRIRTVIKGVNTDNAPISTFHSFCKNTIEEFPFAVNKPSILSLVDENKLTEFAKDYIRKGAILDDLNVYIKKLVQEDNKKFSEDGFVKCLVEACTKYYLDENGNEDHAIITLEATPAFDYLNASSIDDIYKINPDIKYYLEILENSSSDKSQALAAELKANFHTFNFNAGSYRVSKAWPTNTLEAEAREFFVNFKSTLSDMDIGRSIVSKHLPDFYKAWQKEKAKNNYQTFDDMINAVRESVLRKDSALLERLRNKYRYAIIDEFQDTNQKQFDIFSKVFLSENHNIIVVGDPKQSIYSFQGADVEVYRKAVNQIVSSGGEKCFLEKNYRSTGGMVSSCNELFAQQGWFDNFTPSTYLKQPPDDRQFDVLFDDKPIPAFWITKEDGVSKFKYAKLVVQKIVECCTYVGENKTRLMVKNKDDKVFRPVHFNDFTVLAKSRNEMGPIEKALTKAGIPFIRYKDNGLFVDAECQHWITLLQAINEPDFTGERRKIFKRALFTDFFGLSMFEINKKKYNSDTIPEVECFRKWRSIIAKGNYDALIDDILIRSGIVERMTNLNNIQKLNKYRQIGDYCSDFLTKKHSLIDLINNLQFMFNGGSSDDDSGDGSIVRKGTDFECVQIMTIHASKGLQFPVVISVTGLKGYNDNVSNFIYHDQNNNGQQTLTFESNDYTSRERELEHLRLLYVAYTRAQYVMMLPRYELGAKANLTALISKLTNYYVNTYPDKYLPIADNKKGYDKLSAEVKAILPEGHADTKGKDEQDTKLKELIKTKKTLESHKRSYSNLSHPKHEDKEDEYDEDSGTVFDKEGIESEGLAEFDKTSKQIEVTFSDVEPRPVPNRFPKGSDIGSALHEVFEKTNFTNYDDDGLNKLIEERFDANKLNKDVAFFKYIREMVDHVLNAKLPVIHGNKETGESFKLCEIPNEDKKPEIEFNVNSENEKLKNYFNGFIDLLFRRGEYYSILDWKSDSINDRDFPDYKTTISLKNHTDNAYSIQRVLYCYFLIEWLSLKYGPDKEKIFNEHFGGIYYVYLRGCTKDTFNGVYSQTWNSYKDLKAAYDNIIAKCVKGGRK